MPPKPEPKKSSIKSNVKPSNSKDAKTGETSAAETVQQSATSSSAGKDKVKDGTIKNAPAAATLVPVNKKKPLPLLPIEKLLGETLVNAAGETISPRKFTVEDGILGLYFAANWCPPCRILCPELMLLYDEVRKAGHKFQLVFVSFDFAKESFDEYFSKMPWWAVKYEDEERREDLSIAFNVRGIPMFILLDVNTLEVISGNGRVFVSIDPKGENFPWRDMTLPSLAPLKIDPSYGNAKAQSTSEEGHEMEDQTTPAEEDTQPNGVSESKPSPQDESNGSPQEHEVQRDNT